MKEKKFFRVRCPFPMDTGGNWHRLMRFQEHSGLTVNLLPTDESRIKGEGHHLEYDVPDTEYNRSHWEKYLPDYQEIKFIPSVKKLDESKHIEVVPVEQKPVEIVSVETKPERLNPSEIGRLKSALAEELKANGIEIPKNATLGILRQLKAEADTNK
jgi:hypothetical protein